MSTKRGTLTIAGSGIASVAHITLGTLSYIKESDKIFYLVCDPVTEAFIHDNTTADCFDLSVFYDKMCEVRTCFDISCTFLICDQGHVERCQSGSPRPRCLLWASWSFCISLSQQGCDAPWNFRRGLHVCGSRI
jgi:hypothetical protein